MIALLSIGYLATIPAMWLLGVHDLVYLTAFASCSVFNSAIHICALRCPRFMRAGWPLSLVTAVVGMGLIARMFTPFLVAPGLVAVSLMSFAMSSRARDRCVIWLCAVLSVATVLVVYGAEVVGLV